MGIDSILSKTTSIISILTAIFVIITWKNKKLKENKEKLTNHWRDKNNVKITLYEEGPGTLNLDSLEKKLKIKIGLLSSTLIILENSDSIPLAKIKIKIKDNKLEWKLTKNYSKHQLPKKTTLYESIEIYTF